MNSLDKFAMLQQPWWRRIFGLWCRWFGHCRGGVGKSSVYVRGALADYGVCYVCRKCITVYEANKVSGCTEKDLQSDCELTLQYHLEKSE